MSTVGDAVKSLSPEGVGGVIWWYVVLKNHFYAPWHNYMYMYKI